MPEITDGVRVTGSITPTDTTDTYPTHSAEYGKGGHRSVADVTARDAIPADRREEGMTVYVVSTGITFKLVGGITNSNWVGASAGVAIDSIVQGGRITAGIGPYSESGGTNALKFIAAEHNQISLYSVAAGTWLTFSIPDAGITSSPFGTGDDPSDPSDPSQPVMVANKNYDVYVYAPDPSGGDLALWFEPWTGDILRNVSPVRLDGVRVHGNDPEFRYVGTIRTYDDMGTIKTKDDDQQRFVWNEYNRIERVSHVYDSTANWLESNANWTAMNAGNAAWKYEWVSGGDVAKNIVEYKATVEHRIQIYGSDPPESKNSEIGVGYDSTTANDAQAIVAIGMNAGQASENGTQITASCIRPVSPGYHFMQAIARRVSTGGGRMYGDRSQAGFQARIMA